MKYNAYLLTSNLWKYEICYLHGRDILSLNGVLGKITIKEYTYKKGLHSVKY